MEYIVYFQLSNQYFRTWNSLTRDFSTVKFVPKNISSFYLSGKQYEACDEDLQKYGDDILVAANELAEYPKFKNSKRPFHYIQPFQMSNGNYAYRSHDRNVETFFKMFADKDLVDSMEPITEEEVSWFEKCYNGGLQYCQPGIHDSYGYDYSNQYAAILSSKYFKIPNSQGKKKFIKKLPSFEAMKFGIYKVKITSNDPRIKKVFAFSKWDHYTSLSLKTAMNYKVAGYDINIELDTETSYNALIYDKDDLVDGETLFGKWFEEIKTLKQLYPKNMLIKMLSSSLWGHLSRANIKFVSTQDAETMDIGLAGAEWTILEFHHNDDGTGFYKVQNKEQPYKTNFRLKPFVTAYGRMKTASIAELDLDNVIRIHTDNVTFREPVDEDMLPTYLLPEAKTTGLIEWESVNSYKKL